MSPLRERLARLLFPGDDPTRLILLLMAVTCFFGLKSRMIQPDSAGYLMFLTSPFIDGDFDYTNDLDRLGIEPVYRQNNFRPGVGGKPINPFAVGSPLLLAPFFAAGHALASFLRAAGWLEQPAWYLDLDGLYYKTLVVGNATLAAVMMLLIYRLLRRKFSEAASLWTMLLCWFATQIPAYVYLYGNHSHLSSALAGVLVCGLWLDTARRTEARHYFVFGLAAGLAALVRWQDALVVLLALVPLVRPPRYLRCLVATACGFWLVFSIQLLEWYATHGSVLVMPPSQGFMSWFSPNITGTLLSARMGLLTWHPVFILSLVGLRHLYRLGPRLMWGALLALALQVYANGATADWWGGNSFGQRRLLGVLVFLALPMAALYDGTVRPGSRLRAIPWLLGAGLIAFNGLLFLQYYYTSIFLSSGVYDMKSIAANQITVLANLPKLAAPLLAENLWTQLEAVAVPGRLLVLLAWSAMVAGGVLVTRRLTQREGPSD